MPEEASGTGQLLRAVLTGAGRRGVREFGRRVQVRAEGMRNDGRRRKRSAWFLGRLEMRAVVTRYALPESAPEAAALSDLLVGQLPTTVQLLTDTFDVTLRLQAAD